MAIWIRYRSARYQDVDISIARSPAYVTRSCTSNGARLAIPRMRA